jgi:hypothetical protein
MICLSVLPFSCAAEDTRTWLQKLETLWLPVEKNVGLIRLTESSVDIDRTSGFDGFETEGRDHKRESGVVS